MSRPVAIVGPTAVGKSVLGIKIAGHVKGEIVSVDSLQVYRGFDIGTAKPTAGDRRRVPHHLIDILEPTHQLTAGAFGKLARQSIHAIESRGKRPILVGGSGLYLRTVLDGISQIPPTTDQIRSELRIRFENEGLSALRQWLETLDPKTARRIEPGDSQRNIRALEVEIGRASCRERV